MLGLRSRLFVFPCCHSKGEKLIKCYIWYVFFVWSGSLFYWANGSRAVSCLQHCNACRPASPLSAFRVLQYSVSVCVRWGHPLFRALSTVQCCLFWRPSTLSWPECVHLIVVRLRCQFCWVKKKCFVHIADVSSANFSCYLSRQTEWPFIFPGRRHKPLHTRASTLFCLWIR